MRNKIVRSALSLSMAATLVITGVVPAMAAGTSETESLEREERNNAIAQATAAEGMVLLDNQNSALPMKKSGKIALYGVGTYGTVKGGTGSGSTNPKASAKWDVLSAFKDAGYDIVNESFLNAKKEEWQKNGGSGSGMGASAIFDEGAYAAADVDAVAAGTDTAVYVLARNSGEFSDRNLKKGDYYLYDSEAANLALLGEKFENVIVVLNVGGIVDTNFYHGLSSEKKTTEVIKDGTEVSLEKIEGLDALFLMSQGGLEGGNALVKVLNGTVTPSGKLTDTWAINYKDYPSSENFSNLQLNEAEPWGGETLEEIYNDDIYVGYRYFDTYGVDVAYPFGYGLSYTDFAIDVKSVSADEEKVTVQAAVTNRGSADGKEVVEVYFSAPQGKLDKPFQELAAYKKVAVKAGATENVTISFDTTDMSSYDESTDAYIMEKGDYIIRVGNSSRNTAEAGTITLDADAVTEQYRNNLGVTRDELINGTYTEGAVLNNTYKKETVEGWWGPQEVWVGTPHYDAKTKFDIMTGSSNGIDVTPDGITASHSTAALRASNIKASAMPDYTDGEITTYVSEDAASDSAKYLAKGGASAFRQEGTEKTEKVKAVKDATLLDVALGKISVEELVANMSNLELCDLVEGGTYAGLSSDSEGQGPMIGSQADSVPGAAGETTKNLYNTRYIPNIVLADGPAGLRVTPNFTTYTKVAATAAFDASKTYYTMELVETNGWFGPTLTEKYTKATVTAADFAQKLKEGNGLYTAQDYYQYCTAFPIGTLLAQTWDIELIEQMGRAIGTEMLEYSVTSFLAPGMNIHRNPMCGRNFEYYSEDPLIAGMTAAYETKGVETLENGADSGVGVTLKHFAFNNQEADRNGSNSVVSERAAREIYLKGFEIAVRLSKPDYIMTSYNMVNGYAAFLNYGMNVEMLRNEWGFDGFVMTDWGSVGTFFGKDKDNKINVQAKLMYAGNDCEMPGGSVDSLMKGLEEGKDMRLGDLQRSAINMLNIIKKSAIFKKLQNTLMETNRDLQAELDKTKAEMNDKVNAANKQIDALNKELQNAKNQLANAVSSADLATAKQQVTALEKQLSNTLNQILTDSKKYTVKKGKSVKITAMAVNGKKIKFKSNKPKIAKVGKKGKITGVKKGTAKITITAGSASKTVTVTVKK